MFLLWCKNLWKNCVEWINSCQQIPEKDQSYVKVGRNNVHFIKVLKLWVILWSIFRCNVNGEFMFDEQWMKKISQDLTLDFFWFLSKKFFSKIWAAKFRVQFIWGCGLSAGFYGTHVFIHIFQMSLKMLSRRQLFSAKLSSTSTLSLSRHILGLTKRPVFVLMTSHICYRLVNYVFQTAPWYTYEYSPCNTLH